MATILDSGFLYATIDKDDINYNSVVQTLTNFQLGNLVLPTIVLVEVCYLLQARLNHKVMRDFIKTIAQSPLKFEPLTQTDTIRIASLLEQYKDINLDFVDAAIVAISERLNISRILTVDRRDFYIIRPSHCNHFEILP